MPLLSQLPSAILILLPYQTSTSRTVRPSFPASPETMQTGLTIPGTIPGVLRLWNLQSENWRVTLLYYFIIFCPVEGAMLVMDSLKGGTAHSDRGPSTASKSSQSQPSSWTPATLSTLTLKLMAASKSSKQNSSPRLGTLMETGHLQVGDAFRKQSSQMEGPWYCSSCSKPHHLNTVQKKQRTIKIDPHQPRGITFLQRPRQVEHALGSVHLLMAGMLPKQIVFIARPLQSPI